MFEKRRQYLNMAIQGKGIDVVLIDSPSNLYYYTGFTGGEAMFVLPIRNSSAEAENVPCNREISGVEQRGKAVGRTEGYIITDSRYYEQVEKECPELTLIRLEKKGYSQTVRELLEQLEENGIIQQAAGNKDQRIVSGRQNQELTGTESVKIRIVIEETMNLAQYLKLCETCKGCTFQVASDVINESRMVKDEEELKKIAKAEAIGDAAFNHILDIIKPGITETEIALELEFFMKRQGASKLSFDTIVASGANSSMPHAQVTDRRIQNGDFVTMDFGCVYQGYCSDMTRTVAVGEPTEEMKKVYQIVLDANLRAMDGIQEGVSCKEIDALARDYIKDNGYGEYFGHGLGHGVGIDIHEEPRFSPKCEVITKQNMVITDEPGIYLPGNFGVRIEDLVVVKKNGYEQLSNAEKGLIIL